MTARPKIELWLATALFLAAGCETSGGNKNGNNWGPGVDGGGDTDTTTSTEFDTGTGSDGDADADTDADTDTDTDTDTDVDSDTDTDTDSDTGCGSDLDCPAEQFCDGGACIDDICEANTSRCQGDDVEECDSNGGAWSLKYTCGSEAYFPSICVEISPVFADCLCEDDWDCPGYTVCDVDICRGTGEEPNCSLPAEPFANMLPTLEIEWGGESIAAPQAVGSPFPDSAQTVMSPLVVNLDDDNGDGAINELDFPEIVFATFCDSSFKENGVLRAIHGGGSNKGGDYFATCGDTVWHEGDPVDMTCACDDATLNSSASLAAGDLDSDGVPEIVAMLEGVDGSISDGGFGVFDNTGELIFSTGDLNMGYTNAAITLANVDNQGFAEIVIGRHVFTLKHNDQNELVLLDEFEGEHAHGTQNQGPVSCVANIVGDSRAEIIAGTSVYSLPAPPPGVTERSQCSGSYTDPEHIAFCDGALLTAWDGATVNPDIEPEGFCAVADILGADQTTAPSPTNALDGVPEVITISDGRVQIFNGQDGSLHRDIELDGGTRGGAPNVDDFDGDGFPEIGSALSGQYVMIDLQDPTGDCPEWPTPFDDADAGMQGNPPRTGTCLHNGWRRVTEDNSSRVTGSSVFDFNGDGAAEVVYNDECYFRVYDGRNGDVLFKEASPSRTRIEYPIVADVDNDGNAEIVFGASNESGFCSVGNDYNNGLEVWGDANDMWVSARRIWNQHAYHVTNVLEGGGIPETEPESWLEYGGRRYNTYRSNPRSFGVAPDLTITGIQVSSPDAACGELSKLLDITVRVENGGDLRVGPGVVIRYSGFWASPTLLETLYADAVNTPLETILSGSLEPGDSILVTASYDSANNTPGTLPDEVRVAVDFGDAERECDEANNEMQSAVDPGQPMADLRVELGAADAEACPEPTVETTIINDGSAPASNILVRYFAGDPDQGGSVLHERTYAGSIAGGDSVTFIEAMPNFPVDTPVLIYATVDPENAIEECNDGNNTDEADNYVECQSPVVRSAKI